MVSGIPVAQSQNFKSDVAKLDSSAIFCHGKMIRNWFYENTTFIQKDNLMLVLNNPNRIFISDESAFLLCPKVNQVLVQKGSKCVYNNTENDDKECMTVLFDGNAAVEITPP